MARKFNPGLKTTDSTLKPNSSSSSVAVAQRLDSLLADWCFMALSAQTGYIVP